MYVKLWDLRRTWVFMKKCTKRTTSTRQHSTRTMLGLGVLPRIVRVEPTTARLLENLRFNPRF
jgi:hypothetical protein